jgi:hypothetical protein
MHQITRRRLCAALPLLGTVSLAGCLNRGRTHFLSATAGGLEEMFLFGEDNVRYHIHEQRNELLDELFETGEVTTLAATLDGALSHPARPGNEREEPTYILRDSKYYRLQKKEAESTAVETWVVWFEPVERIPDGVTPVDVSQISSEEYGELDSHILTHARQVATTAVVAGDAREGDPVHELGVPYFGARDPVESDLVPEPPFKYALDTSGGHGAPDEILLRLRTDRTSVETTRYVHGVEQVASDENGFRGHVHDTVLDATFDQSTLNEAVQEILDTVDSVPHEEEGSPSAALETILGTLGLSTAELGENETRRSWQRWFAYDSSYYRCTYRITE